MQEEVSFLSAGDDLVFADHDRWCIAWNGCTRRGEGRSGELGRTTAAKRYK